MFIDYKDLWYLMGWYEESKKRKMSREKIVERETYCHHRDIKRS
jgi:hypothetical protein